MIKRFIYSFITVNFFSIAVAFNFDPDDWYVIKHMGSISSITQDNNLVYILAHNGIFTIDKFSGNFEYNLELSDNFVDPQIIFYDEYSDFFWLLTRREIYVRSSVSSSWRNLTSSDLGFNLVRPVYDIGSSPSYIWIDFGTDIIPLHPYGNLISDNTEIDFSEIDLIKWGKYSLGRSGQSLDISKYLIIDDWNVGLNLIKDKDGNILTPTVKLEDSNGDIWIGTEEGVLLKGWRDSYRLEVQNLGPESQMITVFEKDNLGNWWFADSPFMRNEKLYKTSNNKRFIISHWYENENEWNHLIPMDYDKHLSDIHDIHKNDSYLYITTLAGIIIYDIVQNTWDIIEQRDGLKDDAVWDIEQVNNSLFATTKYGINEISVTESKIIPDSNSWINKFDNIEVYDIEIDSNTFYIATEKGLYMFSDSEGILKITDNVFKKIQISNDQIWGRNNSLWLINSENEKKVKNNVTSYYVFNDFVWMTNGRQITLLNIKSEQSWELSLEKGLRGAKIFSLSCDDEWVWFLTDKGIIFYNWIYFNDL